MVFMSSDIVIIIGLDIGLSLPGRQPITGTNADLLPIEP